MSTSTVVPAEPLPADAVTEYEPEALLPSVSVVWASPLLSVNEILVLNDAVPSSGVIRNPTNCPPTGFPSSSTSAVNVNASPGWAGPGFFGDISTENDRGGGGGEASTSTVILAEE